MHLKKNQNCFTKAMLIELLAFVWDGGPRTEVHTLRTSAEASCPPYSFFRESPEDEAEQHTRETSGETYCQGQDCELQLDMGGER